MKGRERLKAMDRALGEKNKELEDAKQWKRHYESANTHLMELELAVGELRDELKASLDEKEEVRNQAKTEKEERDEVCQHPSVSVVSLTICLHRSFPSSPSPWYSFS